MKLEVTGEVELRIIHRGVGGITQDDVNLATVDDAISSASTCGRPRGWRNWPTAKA